MKALTQSSAGAPPAATRATEGHASVRGRLARAAAALVVLAAVVLVWHLLTAVLGVISPARFPTPMDVAAAVQQIVVEGYSNARWHEHVLRSVALVTRG